MQIGPYAKNAAIFSSLIYSIMKRTLYQGLSRAFELQIKNQPHNRVFKT